MSFDIDGAVSKITGHLVDEYPDGRCIECGLVRDQIVAAVLAGREEALAVVEGFASIARRNVDGPSVAAADASSGT